jgi:Tol biopolymer transport system component
MNKKNVLFVLFFIFSIFFLENYLLAKDSLPIYFFQRGKIHKINFDGREEKCLSTGKTSKFQWSPDGENICFMTTKGLFLVDKDNKEKLLTSFPQTSAIVSVFEWSPNNKKIAYGIYKKNACFLWVLDVSSLKTRKIVSVKGPAFQIPFYWSKSGESIYFTDFDLTGGRQLIKHYYYSLQKKKKYLLGVEEWPNNNLVKYVGRKKFHFNQGLESSFERKNDVSGDGQTVFTEAGNIYLLPKDSREIQGKRIMEFKYFFAKFNKGYYNPVWLPNNEYVLVTKEVLFQNSIYLVNVKNGEIKKITKGKAANYFHRD